MKVASGATADSRGCVRSHRISRLIIFMDLTIRTKWSTEILFVFQTRTEDKLLGAVLGRDAKGRRHVVDSHDNKMKKPNEILVG